jgi:2-polyprenyl-6-methoxyphenol hydroxylase-like FAD-dependent oxidoreductase
MTKRTALVIGGGIAGPVTAMALRKAGFEPTVFEAYDRAADGVGAYLTLAVNGIRALRVLDLDGTALRAGIATPRMALHLGSGHKLGEFANGSATPGEPGLVSRTIRRGDLYGALRDEAARRGVPVEYGKRLVDAHTTSTGTVVARFADGSEAAGDLLIGADGLRSRTREIVDPAAPRACYVGLLNAGGYARGVTVPGPPGTLHMIFGRRCFFGYLLAPDGEVWWFANPARRVEPTPAELAAITPGQWRAELLDLFAADAGPAVDLIRATGEIFAGWNTYDFPTVPHWHSGHLVIIGDAAHAASPASGQGASMAVEDAVVLARCLRDEPEIPAAFAAYERLRRRRVERIVRQGRRNGSQKAPGPVGRAVRDAVLRTVFALRPKNARDPMRWIHEHRVEWDPIPEVPVRAAG